jgi:hypothetical protein
MINLYAANKTHRGPGIVYKNLIKGLDMLGQKYQVNVLSDLKEKSIILQDIANYTIESNEKSLIGPNVFNIPDDMPSVCRKYSNFLLASSWIKKKHETFELMKGKKINIWSAGIDVVEWKSETNIKEKEYDCFIYWKNREASLVRSLVSFLKTNKFSFKIIQYGTYSEWQLKDLCNRSKFAIIVGNTETQGIACMQIMSMNIPCYVLNKEKWTHPTTGQEWPATTVPYFDSRCGFVIAENDTEPFSLLDDFFAKVNNGKFAPRDYIVENHTLEKSAKNLIDIWNGV